MTSAAPPSEYANSRWNFTVIVLDAAFFLGALAFIDPVAVLPVLLSGLGASQLVVGLVGSLQAAGWLLPQLFASSLVLHRPRRKPFVVWIAVFSRLPFLALAAVFSLSWGAAHLEVLLVLLIVMFGLFFFSDGLIGVPWHDIVARTIRPDVRGRFFGSMQFLSGLLAIGAAALVRHTLADPSLPFPQNYGRLFVYFSVGMLASLALILFIKEPRRAPVTERQGLGSIIRAIPATLRSHPALFRLVLVQNAFGISGLALPFYAVYADSQLRLPGHVGGLFVGAAMVGSICASPVWAYVNDRLGCLTVIRQIPLLLTTVPLAALLVPRAVMALGAESAMPYAYASVFFLNGAAFAGRWMGFTNYLYEIAPGPLRPLFLGLSATLCAPSVLMPLLGGFLLSLISYQSLFAITAAGGVVALAFAYRLGPSDGSADARATSPPDASPSWPH
jgi:MFS family permease